MVTQQPSFSYAHLFLIDAETTRAKSADFSCSRISHLSSKMAKPGTSYHDPNHHRSETKPNKPFKGRHGHKSKSAIKAITKGCLYLVMVLSCVGKVEKTRADKLKVHVPSKIDRRNTQKQILKKKKEELVRNAKFFGGARGAAKIVVGTRALRPNAKSRLWFRFVLMSMFIRRSLS